MDDDVFSCLMASLDAPLVVVTQPLLAEAAGPFRPLRLSDVDDLTPGHEVTERNNPPTERAKD